MAESAPVKPEAIYKFEKLAVSNFPYEPRKRGGYGIFFYEGYGTPLPPTKEQTKFLLEIRRVITFTYSVELIILYIFPCIASLFDPGY